MIPTLPSDIVLVIVGNLCIQDILNARQVKIDFVLFYLFLDKVPCKACRNFYALTKLRSLWDRLIHERVLRHNIPIPGLAGRTIDSLDAQELERGLYKALKLDRNWRSQSPAVVRQTSMLGVPDSRVISLRFITEQGRRWLVSLSRSTWRPDDRRKFTIQCWDLHASPPSCAAERELQYFGGMAINQGVSIVGSIAILNPQ